MIRYLKRAVVLLGWFIGFVICEPQLRLGRRRHDNHCDRCETHIDRYACERLHFDKGGFDTDSALGKMKMMYHATYQRFCLECTDEIEG